MTRADSHAGAADAETAAPSTAALTVYASGNFAKNILWHSAEVSALFIFTDLVGYPPAAAATLILISLLWDAALDPVVGFAADHLRSPIGRYGPFLLVGAPLASATFVLLFCLPLLAAPGLWLGLVVLLAFRAAYSLIDLPHNAMIASITSDSHMRTRIALLRFLFSSLASLALSIALPIILMQNAGASTASRFAVYAVGAAVASAVVIVASWSAVRRFDAARPPEPHGAISPARAARALLSNRPFLILLAAGALASFSTPMFSKTAIYLAKYVLHSDALAGRMLTAMVIGQIVGLPLWTWAARRGEKARAMAGAHALVALASAALLAALAAPGIAPEIATGTGAGIGGVAPLYVLPFAFGVGGGGVYALVWALLPDSVDHGQQATGARLEGLHFGVLTLGMKAASAVGSLALGLALDLTGYAPDAEQAGAVRVAIAVAALGAPCLGSIVCALLLSRYRITHAVHGAVVRALRDGARGA